jgi:single-stranded-DNA-specific exonuclease
MSQVTAAPKRWIEPAQVGEDSVRELTDALGLPDDVCLILLRRGLATFEEARRFLRPSLAGLHDPGELPDIGRAVERVQRAISGAETILVHGDYDADGMCAAALLTRGLQRLGGRIRTFVPHRTRDGYDLSEAGLDSAGSAGATLIVTADCGVTAVDAVAKAGESGIDVVVTDHHRPGDRLPEAVAVVNPVRRDSRYPFRGLAGVGVVFKLLTVLYDRYSIPDPELNQHLDLVAVGTVADQMPLLGENRILVRAGLRALSRTRKPGLRALLARVGIPSGGEIEAEHISFRLGPRLNAVGRMAAPEAGLQLLVTEDKEEADRLAEHLDQQNAQRRLTDSRVFAEVEALLETRFDGSRDRAVVLWGDGWHPGVVGIVASRLVERLNCPAVVVTFDGEVGRGSGRSVEGFNLYEALRQCEHLLERFGGHRMAAGLSIRRSRIEEFAGRVLELAARDLSDREAVEELRLDLVLPLAGVQRELQRWLAHLGPFGAGNPSPVLMVPGVGLGRTARVGAAGGHLRAELVSEGGRLPAIGFGLGRRVAEARALDRVDVAFELTENRWNGRRELQARILDFRPAAT